MELVSILEATNSFDGNKIKEAYTILEQAAVNNFPQLLISLSEIICNVHLSQIARCTAAVFLKNNIGSSDKEYKKRYIERWLGIPAEIRECIKQRIFMALGTEGRTPSMFAQCISVIAVAELPHGEWNGIIGMLVEKFHSPDSNDECKLAILDAIGFTCEDINYNVLIPFSDMILSLLVEGINPRYDRNIRICAMRALYNSLESCANNFNKKEQRNYLVELICTSTDDENLEVRIIAMKSLCKIVRLYYPYLHEYMSHIFQITVKAMSCEDEAIVLEGIEFWSSLCDEEYDIKSQQLLGEQNETSNVCQDYASGALGPIIPLMVNKIIMSREDEDLVYNYTPVITSRVCLKLFANVVGDAIIPVVLPFVSEAINHSTWQMREASCLVIGSVIEGPSSDYALNSFHNFIPQLISLVYDSSVAVRDTAAWAIGRIFEQIPQVIHDRDILAEVVKCALENVDSPPRVQKNVLWMLTCLFYVIDEVCFTPENIRPNDHVFSEFFFPVMERLLQLILSDKSINMEVKSFQFEALIGLIKTHPTSKYEVVMCAFQTIFNGMPNVMQAAPDNTDRMILLSLYCAFLQIVFHNLRTAEFLKIYEYVFNYLLNLLSSSESAENAEDIFCVISKIFSLLPKENLFPLVETIKPYLNVGFKTLDEPYVFEAAAAVLNEITENLGADFLPHADLFISLLLEAFNSPTSNNKIKVQCIFSMSDVAIAIGLNFRPYSKIVLEAFITGVDLVLTTNCIHPDQAEELFEYQIIILSAFSAVVQNICQKEEVEYLVNNNQNIESLYKANLEIILRLAPTIIECINSIISQPIPCSVNVLEKSFSLIGDIVQVLQVHGSHMVISCGIYSKMIAQAYRSNCKTLSETISWVDKLLKSYGP